MFLRIGTHCCKSENEERAIRIRQKLEKLYTRKTIANHSVCVTKIVIQKMLMLKYTFNHICMFKIPKLFSIYNC